MGEACACGAWVGRQESHACEASKAVTELATMMQSITAGWSSWFGMGKMRSRRVLSNGAVVTVTITMPKVPAQPEGDPNE